MKELNNSTPHLSEVYDNQILNTIPYYECFHNEAINIVKSVGVETKIWLDTGAGTGTFVKKCIGIFPNTLFLLADPSSEMLDEAKKKLAGYREDRIQFLDPVGMQQIDF